MADATVVVDRDDMRRTLARVAHEIVEKNPPPAETAAPPPTETAATARTAPEEAAVAGAFALVGIHRRGAVLAQRLKALTDELTGTDVALGFVDISFYRDDLQVRRDRDPAFAPGQLVPIVHATQLDFPIDGQRIVIVDDVLYTGRTVRAALDAILDYGRPAQVQLATLIDRGHRELPIRPDFIGKNLPTARDQRVNVHVEELDGIDEVTIGPARTLGRSAA